MNCSITVILLSFPLLHVLSQGGDKPSETCSADLDRILSATLLWAKQEWENIYIYTKKKL